MLAHITPNPDTTVPPFPLPAPKPPTEGPGTDTPVHEPPGLPGIHVPVKEPGAPSPPANVCSD